MDLLAFWNRQKRLFSGQKSPIYRDLSIQGFAPKRDAARSNRAGDANPPKTLRFRGILFSKTSPINLLFIISDYHIGETHSLSSTA